MDFIMEGVFGPMCIGRCGITLSLNKMIHTTLLVFAISVYVCSVAFLYLKDFLPACNGNI